MQLSVHLIVDQVLQRIDSKICQKECAHLKVPPNMRMLALFLQTEEPLSWRVNDKSVGIQYWDPPKMAFDRADLKKLGQIRRIIPAEDVRNNDDKRAVSAYLETVVSLWDEEFLDECMVDVERLLAHVANGDICVKGWFEDGRLNFDITPLGARRLKIESPVEGVFFLYCHGFAGWKALDWPDGYPTDN